VCSNTGTGEDSHSTAQIDGKNSDLGGEAGTENLGNSEGYPPSSQTPPLEHSKKPNGNNHSPPPAPTIPPPPLDDENGTLPPPYTNGNGRSIKDSPV